ncbi:cytochrome P450 [Streptomyces sp. NPDC056716]|uniref:cytochrome P450 n=1 Tax=unclassified Streptomyces TaxID=2593676 RepID=UPI0036BCABDF
MGSTLGESITLAELERDPFPWYARLRAEQPVAWVPAAHAHFITKWDDVVRVARDTESFSAAVHDSPLTEAIGPNLLHSDGTYHAHRRAPLTAALRPSALLVNAEPTVRDLVSGLIGELRSDAGRQADLISAFAVPLCVRTLCAVTGLPPGLPDEQVWGWIGAITTGAANYERDPAKKAAALAAGAEITEVVRDVLREGPPAGSLLEGLAAAETESGPMTLAEIVSTVQLLVIGGMQEPRDLFGIALGACLADPELEEEARAGRGAVERVVEEALRWGSPVGTLTRRVVRPADVAGVRLPEGTVVAAVLASANRDEEHWEAPDVFDPHRRQSHHLAFGGGVHACVGAPLARTMVTTAITAMLDTFPSLRLTAAPPFHGWEFRGPTRLQVEWSRSGAGGGSGTEGGGGRAAVAVPGPPSGPPRPPALLDAVVTQVREEAPGVRSVRLELRDGGELPPWQPGAHIDVHLPEPEKSGGGRSLARSYSLCGSVRDRKGWRIAVKLDPEGRGGSRRVHRLNAGDVLRVSRPRQHFPLPDRPSYVFVAGGIGITPLLPMIEAVEAAGRPWRLLNVVRSNAEAPFHAELACHGDWVDWWDTAERGRPDLAALALTGEEAVVCCGPEGLMATAERLAVEGPAVWRSAAVSVERFHPRAHGANGPELPFELHLAGRGEVVQVAQGCSALDALERAGVLVPSTCREGTCGSCEVRVVSGDIDHRDSLLTPEERARGDLMLVCVSRAAGEALVVDL